MPLERRILSLRPQIDGEKYSGGASPQRLGGATPPEMPSAPGRLMDVSELSSERDRICSSNESRPI